MLYSAVYLRFNVGLSEPGTTINFTDETGFEMLSIILSDSDSPSTTATIDDGEFEGSLDRYPTAGTIIELSASGPTRIPQAQLFRFE